jgi:hypothetical protein
MLMTDEVVEWEPVRVLLSTIEVILDARDTTPREVEQSIQTAMDAFRREVGKDG